jgi:hypothetical protein
MKKTIRPSAAALPLLLLPAAVGRAPFAGILLSIALCPLLAPSSGTTTTARSRRPGRWPSCCRFAAGVRPPAGRRSLVHALLAEYIPFIILLTALFTVAGGIYIRGNLHGSPG